MPDDLYERDVLAWSERQAALLRRVARDELPNDLDLPFEIGKLIAKEPDMERLLSGLAFTT